MVQLVLQFVNGQLPCFPESTDAVAETAAAAKPVARPGNARADYTLST